MTTTPPSLWAVLLSSWLHSVRQPGEHGRALSTALALCVPAWAPRGADRDRAVRWYEVVTAALDALPRERQGAVAAWAAVSAWTEAYESAQGAVWGRLADAATPLARSLGDDAETAREADDLAALGRVAWERERARWVGCSAANVQRGTGWTGSPARCRRRRIACQTRGRRGVCGG